MRTKFKVASVGRLVASACLLCVGANSLPAGENDSKPMQFVYVSGEVKVPNRYIYTDGLTLGSAIKMAKGVTPKASQNVTLTRQGTDVQRFSLKRIQTAEDKDIKLQPGDRIFVPRK